MPSYSGQEQLYVSKFSLCIKFIWRVSSFASKFTVFLESVTVPVNRQLSARSCNYSTVSLDTQPDIVIDVVSN
jgi:hypothetical protein